MKSKAMRNLFLYLFILMFLLQSCEHGFEYKYANEPVLLSCDNANERLISEAVYTFEDYLMNSHVFREPLIVEQGYANYWGIATSDRLPRIDTFDPHVIKVFEALKKEEDLWKEVNGEIRLNYSNSFMRCIEEGMTNREIRSTMKSLLDTNTFRTDIFTPAIRRRTDIVAQDKALSTLVALDMFYAKLFSIDLSRDPLEIMEEERTSHSGHNH